MLPFLHESNEIFRIRQKINLNLSSKSIVSLLSHTKSTQIQSNLLKSARTTQTARIQKKLKQLQLNSPSQIQILPNLPEFTPIRQIVEIAYNLPTSIRRNRNPAEPLQINRIVLIQPRSPKSTQTNRNTTQSSIPPNTQTITYHTK